MNTLEVITGPMFSGKTEELIRRVRLSVLRGGSTQFFGPVLDRRYGVQPHTHAGRAYSVDLVETSQHILAEVRPGVTCVAIDEVQFFDELLPRVVSYLMNSLNKRVIAAGLNRDYRGEPFANTERLLSMADVLVPLHSVCTSCGADATCTYRKGHEEGRIVPGGAEAYEARCRSCYTRDAVGLWSP